jgi:hypothetical protein
MMVTGSVVDVLVDGMEEGLMDLGGPFIPLGVAGNILP